MIARPILFSSPMIRALLDGRKTQTRRAIQLPQNLDPRGSWEPSTVGGTGITDARGHVVPPMACIWHTWTGALFGCPYGVPGDLLYVREMFSGFYDYDEEKVPPRAWFKADPIWYWADGNPGYGDWTKPKPGIHMPRWASRLTLRITEVRVQRLQDISDDDAVAEGVDGKLCASFVGKSPMKMGHAEKVAYAGLWDSLNGPGSWGANPHVWCVSFEVIKQNVDAVLASRQTA